MSKIVNQTTDNIYITGGKLLSRVSPTVYLYDFDYVHFSDCKVIHTFNYGKKELSLVGASRALEDTSSALFLWTLGDASPVEYNVLGMQKWEEHKKLSSCIVSPNNSIIPRPYIPYNPDIAPLVDNGVYTTVTKLNDETEKMETKGRYSEVTPRGNGLNWYCKTDDTSKIGSRKVSNQQMGYVDMNGCVSIKERSAFGNGTINKIEREYFANIQPGVNVGSFAFIVNFQEFFGEKENEIPKTVITTGMRGNDVQDGQLAQRLDIVFSKGAGMTAKINNSNTVTENLDTGMDNKVLPPQCDGIKTFDDGQIFYVYPVFNGVAITGNILNYKADTNALMPKITHDLGILESIENPTLDELSSNILKKKPIANNVAILENIENCFYTTENIKVSWINSVGAFAYVPLAFPTSFKMSYYFIGQRQQDALGKNDNFAIPVFFQNGSKYYPIVGGGSHKAQSVGKITLDTSKQEIFKFDFDFQTETPSSRFQMGLSELPTEENDKKNDEPEQDTKVEHKVRPIEVFGFVHVKRKIGNATELDNNDGEFLCDSNITSGLLDNIPKNKGRISSNFYGANNDWMEYITSVNISHEFKGTSGSFTLDKYAMMTDMYALPKQSIGAVTFKIENGPYGNVSYNGVYDDVEKGLIFKGYAMEISNDVASDSPTLGVSLYGINKKIDDLQAMYVPYWDGNQFFGNNDDYGTDILTYFRNYTGCDLRYKSDFTKTSRGKVTLPMSENYANPTVYIKDGTSCTQALEEICELVNHLYIVQPNGKGYFYEQDDSGTPYWINDSKNMAAMHYKSTDIISFTLNPNLDNKYNRIAVFGLVDTSTQDSNINRLESEVKTMQQNITPKDGVSFPWSRMVTHSVPGIQSLKKLQKIHKTFIKQHGITYYNGSITVPGYPYFFLLDKITIDGNEYYITGISHSISLTDKQWTSTLNIMPVV